MNRSGAGLTERQASQHRSAAESWAKAKRPENRSEAGLTERQARGREPKASKEQC